MTDVWDVIVPAAGVNYCTNPSAETGTTGWPGTSNITVSREVGGVNGAYCFTGLANDPTVGRAVFVGPALANGTAFVASAWVWADSPLVYLTAASLTNVGTAFHPGDSQWHRLEATTTSLGSACSIVVGDSRSSGWTTFKWDGAQLELGTEATTYIDGDQDGCSWDSGVHASVSRRAARDGRGGRVVSFDSLDLDVRTFSGIGLPRMAVATTAPAFADGEFYQRSLAKSRVVLMNVLIRSTGIADLHATRRAALDALGPDLRANRGPITLRYRGQTDQPRRLHAYYEAGFDFSDVGPYHEMLGFRYLAPDPYWYAETDSQASLTPYDTLSSVSGIAQRDPDGVWSTMGGGITTPLDLYALTLGLDGTLYAGGVWTSGAGSSSNLAKWNGSAWSTVGGVSPNNAVFAIAVTPGGILYVGGLFTQIGGASRDKIGTYNGTAWSSVGTTPATCTDIRAMLVDAAGLLWVVGNSTTAGAFAYSISGTTWTDRGTNGAQGPMTSLAIGSDGRIYAGTSVGVYYWSGSAWTSIGARSGGTAVYAVAWGPDGCLYAGGDFTSIGGVGANGVARWDGSGGEPLGSGLTGGSAAGFGLSFLPTGELIVVGAFTSAGGFTCSDSIAVWNGSSWRPFEVNLPGTLGTAITYCLLAHPNGAVTAGRTTSGNAITPGITAVTNAGTAPAYPVIKAVFANDFQAPFVVENLTTGQAIRCNPNGYIFNGEAATLGLRPGHKTFRTQTRNLIATVLPGSDFDGFVLVPGENRIACFVESSGVAMHAYWTPRYLSAD